jgi:ATP-binding cassette subfamily B protein
MQNPYFSLLKTAWRYARKEKSLYLFIYFLFVCANVVSALNPLLYGWFINVLQKDSASVIKNAWWYVAGYMALNIFEWVFHGPARVLERKLAFNMSRNFLDELYHQTLHLPVKWQQDHHSGATINRIRKAYEALRDFFQNGFMYLHAFSKFVFSFAAMVYFSPIFGGIGVLLGILTVYVIFLFDKPFIKSLDETNEKEHIVSSTLFDSLSNIITVITLRLEKSMQNSILEKVKAVFPPFMRQVRINEWKWFVASILIGLIYITITMGYVYQNYEPGKVFLLGGLVTLLGYVNQFTSVFQDIAWQYTEIVRYNTDVQTARSIGEAYFEYHLPDSNSSLPANWQNISINNLNFSHNTNYSELNKAQSLHNINFQIKKSKKIALIGESGCGKSTLLAIIRGLYSPEKTIKVNVDESLTSMEAIANTVTLFPQEPEIFENTIEYNITLGLPYEQKLIHDIAESVQFTDLIEQLPNGLASNIQEKGVNLSGGQKQRLALARGVLAASESEIILLDEPTSSIDAKTEAQIFENLFTLFKNKAIIASVHRLHLLANFDYIYLMEKGKIVEEGSFSDMKNKGKLFQELWKHQVEN